MEQSRSSEANNQEPKSSVSFHKSPKLKSILSKLNPINTIIPSFFKSVLFNTIL